MKVTDEMVAGVSVKNVDTSPERDKKSDDSLHDKRVEAAARAIYDAATALVPDAWEREAEDEKAWWLNHAREVLRAADAVCCAHPKCPGGSLCCCQSDAVVTEEMIAETILKALVFTNENSKAWADGLARDIAALFRGGTK